MAKKKGVETEQMLRFTFEYIIDPYQVNAYDILNHMRETADEANVLTIELIDWEAE